MPASPEVIALVDRVNVATDKVAARLDSQVVVAALVAAQTDEAVRAILRPSVERLETLGENPTTPIPPEPPVEPLPV